MTILSKRSVTQHTSEAVLYLFLCGCAVERMITRRQATLLLTLGPSFAACQSLGLCIAAVQRPLRTIGLEQLATVLDACPAVVSLQYACSVVAMENGVLFTMIR
jgi:hypothetical protein